MGLVERSGEIWRSSWSSSDWPKFQKTMCLCYVLSLISVSNVSIPRFHDLWHIFEPDSCVLFSFFPWKNWKTPEKLINVGTMGCHPALKQLTMSLAKLPQVDLWREEPGQWWHRPGAFQAPCTIFLLKWKVVGFIDSAYVIIRYLYMCVYHCLFISLINLLHIFFS